MQYYINRHAICILDRCSNLSGMLFQLNWNTVPTYLEQESNLAVTRRELKKLTTRAYRVANERWGLEVGNTRSQHKISWGYEPKPYPQHLIFA